MQKLLVLQRWLRHRLGGCFHTHADDQGQGERVASPVSLFRLLYRLGVDDDCPIHLSAAKALGVEPPPGVIPSIDPLCGSLADDTQQRPPVSGAFQTKNPGAKYRSPMGYEGNDLGNG
jgi:hypothetical protein